MISTLSQLAAVACTLNLCWRVLSAVDERAHDLFGCCSRRVVKKHRQQLSSSSAKGMHRSVCKTHQHQQRAREKKPSACTAVEREDDEGMKANRD